MTQVGWSIGYLKAATNLTPNEQSLVNKAVVKFQSDPYHPSLNFEKLTGCKDDKIYSIRVNQDIRIIISASCKDQPYLLLYVDHHDAAYQWANRQRVEINPYTGVIQCYTVIETEVEEAAKQLGDADRVEKSPFLAFRDRELLALGVPEPNLKSVRNLLNEDDLEAALEAEWLPQDAYNGLFMLLAGASYEEAHRESNANTPAEVDTEDFSKALKLPQTLAGFVVADNETELEAALTQSIEKWRVFLHPSQRSLVSKSWVGPACVVGAAGTGKTVVAIHRAKWLIQNVLKENEKVLLVTFNVNLALDIQSKIESFLSVSQSSSIEVFSIDKLALTFLNKNGVSACVVFDGDSDYERVWRHALDHAKSLGFPDSFFREEWSQVLQPKRITARSDYLLVDRSGRGVALSRMQRSKVWSVFEQVITALSDKNLITMNDALFLAADIASSSSHSFYRSILVDETQDMSVASLRFIRSLTKEDENGLLFFGDPRQNIYMQGFSFLDAGIDISGRIDHLYTNYRTSSNIQSLAESFLDQKFVFGSAFSSYQGSKCRSLISGVPASVQGFDTSGDELEAMLEALLSLSAEGVDLSDICIACRTKTLCDKVASFLSSAKVKTYLLSQRADERLIGGVRLATFHRIKGLEFRHVFLFGFSSDCIPPRRLVESTEDPVELCKIQSVERSLAYVAATRARERLYISYTGEPCYFLII